MSDQRARKGISPAFLLLIPAAVIIAKGASRRRARWGSMYEGPGGHHGYGRHGFGPGGEGTFRLPPKIEATLDAWHTQAHANDEAEGGSVSA